MNNVSINNPYENQNLQRNYSNPAPQQDFGALDKAQLKQDAVEIANKAKEDTKENFVSRAIRNVLGVEPKKLFISLGLTVLTVVGGATIGNKLSNPTAKMGLNVDEFFAKNKIYTTVGDFFKGITGSIGNFFKNSKSKTVQDILETFKNRKAKARCGLGRGYGHGFSSIFALTPVDILEKTFAQKGIINKKGANNLPEATKLMKKLVGEVKTKEGKLLAEDLAKEILGSGSGARNNIEFCNKLSSGMREYLGCKNDHKKFLNALLELQNGKLKGQDVSEFSNIIMKGGGPIGSWWPVNIFDSIGRKIRGDKWKGFCRGNLGDSLVKFNVVNGKLAKTKVGSLAQKITTVPTESITNFVNDKSGMGVILCAMIVGLYNKVQDAPKEKKAATMADDFIGTLGSIAIAAPIASALVYGAASLKNLKGASAATKALRGVGKFFGMGLDRYAKGTGKALGATKNWIPRIGGGILRFGLIMFVLPSKISKPIYAAIHKVFGKPYEEGEEHNTAQNQQKNDQLIPELGITQLQLEEKMKSNPSAVEKLQTDAAALEIIKNDPKKLIDYLDGKDITKTQAQSTNTTNVNNTQTQQKKNPFDVITAPKQPINSNGAYKAVNNNQNNALNKTSTNTNNNTTDTATYIPSSNFKAKNSSLSTQQTDELNAALAKSDRILERAQKLIGG